MQCFFDDASDACAASTVRPAAKSHALLFPSVSTHASCLLRDELRTGRASSRCARRRTSNFTTKRAVTSVAPRLTPYGDCTHLLSVLCSLAQARSSHRCTLTPTDAGHGRLCARLSRQMVIKRLLTELMAATVPHRSSSSFTIGPLELETTAGDSQDDSEDTSGRAAWTAGCKLAEILLLEDKHAVREWFPPGARVLELGCGCGVAGCAVAARDPAAHVLFTDSSTACLDTAARNAARFGADARRRCSAGATSTRPRGSPRHSDQI